MAGKMTRWRRPDKTGKKVFYAERKIIG